MSVRWSGDGVTLSMWRRDRDSWAPIASVGHWVILGAIALGALLSTQPGHPVGGSAQLLACLDRGQRGSEVCQGLKPGRVGQIYLDEQDFMRHAICPRLAGQEPLEPDERRAIVEIWDQTNTVERLTRHTEPCRSRGWQPGKDSEGRFIKEGVPLQELKGRYLMAVDYEMLVSLEEPLWQIAVDGAVDELVVSTARMEWIRSTLSWRMGAALSLIVGAIVVVVVARRRTRQRISFAIRGAALEVEGRRMPWDSLKSVDYSGGRVVVALRDGTVVKTPSVRPERDLGAILVFARSRMLGEADLTTPEDLARLRGLVENRE